MPLPYRTILRLPPQTDLIALAEQEVQAWLEDRNKVTPDQRAGFITGTFFEPGVHDLGDRRTLAVARLDGEGDGSRCLLFRFTEPSPSGVWQVDVVALDFIESAQRNDTLVIEATRIDEPDADGQVDPPAVVRRLLAREDVFDGVTPVTSEPRMVGADQSDEVLDAILDPARSVSVIVAASLGHDTDENLRATIRSLTSKFVGAASVFVITREAAATLNERLPASHGIEPGRVRTYLPHVDLEDAADGRRHRVLGPQSFARAIRGQHVTHYLQEAFALQTRSALLAQPMPRALRRRRNSLEDELARITRETVVEQQLVEAREESIRKEETEPKTALPSVVDRLARLVRRWLGRQDAEVQLADVDQVDGMLERLTLEQQVLEDALERAEAQITDAQISTDALQSEFEYRGLELAESERESVKLRDQVRYLQRELVKAGNAVAAYGDANETDWSTPPDLVELALLLTPDIASHPAASLVVFTGDIDQVSETDARDQNGLYVQRCWEFVRVLYDYAQRRREGTFAGNVHSYLQSPDHDGTKVSVSRHAPSETKQTIDGWGSEREFPVPEDCAPAGSARMYAHFKAGQDSTFAPRMYYYDDIAKTGKIYIGYIGRHLHNTKTANV